MALTLITAPAVTPVTVEDAKAWLRVDHTDDDEFIEALIDAVTAHLDGKYGLLQRALEEQTWELALDEFPCDNTEIQIPLPPLLSIVSVKYDDGDGVEQTIDAGDYDVDSRSVPGWVVPVSTFTWPTTLDAVNAVRIRFTAGYEEDASGTSGVPNPIKTAIKLMVADLYENRESVTHQNVNQIAIPTAAKMLLAPYVIHAFA